MTNLKEGDKAPDFTAKDQNGKEHKLSDYKGKKVVLYFYPKDDTPGCTKEACNLRDNFKMLEKEGFLVIGVSTDSEKSHQKFIEKYNLPFPLLADEDKELVQKYGVWGEKSFMGRKFQGTHRVTFIINEDGVIEKVFEKVKTGEHAEQILAAYAG